jgi:hypothetical protein
MRQSMIASEWVLIGSIALILGSFWLVAQYHRAFGRSPERYSVLSLAVESPASSVTVAISGAVKRPGEYVVSQGTTLQQVLRKALPMASADLSSLPLQKFLETSQAIEVPELREIRIFVEGAVLRPVELLLPAGSRIFDLRGKIDLSSEADRKFLKRKKLLRHGDRIQVPVKVQGKK